MNVLVSLFNSLPGAAGQGLIWGIMAIGVYITYKILDVADLTVDGSLATGGAVAALCVSMGWCAAYRLRNTRHPGGYSDPTGPLLHQPAHHGHRG